MRRDGDKTGGGREREREREKERGERGRERKTEGEREQGGGVLCRKVYSLLAKVGKEFLI